MCSLSVVLGFAAGVALWMLWSLVLGKYFTEGFAQVGSLRAGLGVAGSGMYGKDPIEEFRKQIVAAGMGGEEEVGLCKVCGGVIDPQLLHHKIGYWNTNYPRCGCTAHY